MSSRIRKFLDWMGEDRFHLPRPRLAFKRAQKLNSDQQHTLEDKATGDSFELVRIFGLKASPLMFFRPCMAARQANPNYESQYRENVDQIITAIDNAIDKYGYTGTAEQQIFRNWIYFYLTSGDAQDINDAPALFAKPKKYKKHPFINSNAVENAIRTWDSYSQDYRFTYAQMHVPKQYFDDIAAAQQDRATDDAANTNESPQADPNA